MSLPPSHLVPAPEPPYLSPMDMPRDTCRRPERSKSPQTIETLNPEAIGSQGRRTGSSRTKKEGGRSTHKVTDDGCREGPKLTKSNRGRSKERSVKGKRESTRSPGGTKLPHINGNSNMEHYSGGTDLDHKKSRQLDRGLGESRPVLPPKSTTTNSSSMSALGRKATVSPGPWKIPGSDKLPSTLRSGTSTLSR